MYDLLPSLPCERLHLVRESADLGGPLILGDVSQFPVRSRYQDAICCMPNRCIPAGRAIADVYEAVLLSRCPNMAAVWEKIPRHLVLLLFVVVLNRSEQVHRCSAHAEVVGPISPSWPPHHLKYHIAVRAQILRGPKVAKPMKVVDLEPD